MCSQGGMTIRYTGVRLDQVDLTHHEAVTHAVRRQGLGDKCRVTSYQLLKIMGKRDTGGNREVLDKRLARLKATAVEIRTGRYTYMGSLIDEVYKDEETHEYVIRLNPKLCPLFAKNEFTQVEWVERRQLEGKPLAQWLHGYYASHAVPYPLKVETLRDMSGSDAGELKHFRAALRKALAALAAVSGWEWEIDDQDLVYVRHKPSRSQKQHIRRRSHDKKKT